MRRGLPGAVGCLVALAFLGGCVKKPMSARNAPYPATVNLTNVKASARYLKHMGIVNKRLVRYLIGQRMYGLAVQHAEEMLKRDHQDAELYYLRGFALRELGQYDRAVKSLQTAAELHRGYAQAWNALGMTYDLMKKPKQAEGAYLEALRINPASSKYLNNLGFSYFSQGHYDRAIELYQKALASDPLNVQIHNNLGFAYGLLGRYPEAIAEFKQAGRDEVVYNNLGFLYYMLGLNVEAQVMYAKALEINPRFAKARNNLRLIEGDMGGYSFGTEIKGRLKP